MAGRKWKRKSLFPERLVDRLSSRLLTYQYQCRPYCINETRPHVVRSFVRCFVRKVGQRASCLIRREASMAPQRQHGLGAAAQRSLFQHPPNSRHSAFSKKHIGQPDRRSGGWTVGRSGGRAVGRSGDRAVGRLGFRAGCGDLPPECSKVRCQFDLSSWWSALGLRCVRRTTSAFVAANMLSAIVKIFFKMVN